MPYELQAELIEKTFGIVRCNKQEWIMNFYGVQINFLSSRRFRLSLIFQLAAIAWIIVLVLLDGWLLQVRQLSSHDTCPQQSSDCFSLTSIVSHVRINCEPGHKLTNLTSSKAMCFVWMYNELSTVAFINQIGISSSIISILCHAFKGFCCISRKWFGLILLILFALGGVVAFTVTYILLTDISMIGSLLIMGLCGILINVIQLNQFTYNFQRKTHASKT